jgi:metal-sulfur cluster biosynthetic enzyme
MTTAEVAHLLRHVFDPELGIDIVSLGLVYGIEADDDRVTVTMTTTTPECPMGEALRGMVDAVLHHSPGPLTVIVELVYEPPWNVRMATPAALRHLGIAAA